MKIRYKMNRLFQLQGIVSCIFLNLVVSISAMEVTTTQFFFWFKDKLHDDWILEKHDRVHFVTCLQKCRNDADCQGLALGPLNTESEDFQRPCHTLSTINETDCYDSDECNQKGFQVFHLTEPFKQVTTSKTPSTTPTFESSTTSTSTMPFSTTTSERITTTAEEPPTTSPATTISEFPTTSHPITTTTAEPTTTTTEKPTTTTIAETTTTTPSTTSEIPTTTTKGPTTTKETSSTSTEPTTTTSTKPTTTTSTEPTTTTSTKPTTTSTTEPTTTTSTEPTTTTSTEPTTTSTTEPTTTTAMEPTTTTAMGPTTTTAMGPTTTTTEKPTTITTEQTTTLGVSTTASADCPETEVCEPQEIPADCNVDAHIKECPEPRDRSIITGLKAVTGLFTDATLDVKCESLMNPIFSTNSYRKAYSPFSGPLRCKHLDTEVITGVAICFQIEVKYVAIECTEIKENYILEPGEGSSNSQQDPKHANCPSPNTLTGVRLSRDNDEITVKIECGHIGQK